MSDRLPNLLRLAVILGSLLLLALQALQVAKGWDYYQYDWRAYYIGADLFIEGLDPYAFDLLEGRARELGLTPNDHPFLYAPYMLWAFAPLALLSYPTAYFCWLALQIGALAVVLRAALKTFGASPAITMALLAIGLNGTVAAVLRTGQLALMITALLMLAVMLIGRQKLVPATALVTVAALPKLWPAPMFGLLLKRFEPRRVVLIVAGLAAFAAVIALGALIHPEFQATFSAAMAEMTAGDRINGPQNGSALNALRTGFALVGGNIDTANDIWLGLVAVVAVVALARYVQTVRRDAVDPAYLYSLIALSLSLAMPRLMIYQWVVALPALAYVLTHMSSRTGAWILLAVALVPTLYINRYALGRDLHELLDSLVLVPWAFSNLVVAACAWLVLVTSGPDMAATYPKPIRQD